MVHSAYDTVELVAGVPGRIEAVASHTGTLLVADSKCSLHIYSAPVPADGESRRNGPYALARQQPRLWSKAPSAMEASASRGLLLSLSDLVALHRLPGLETVAFISKTKSTNIFAWDDCRGLLAVGRQRRLTIFRLDSENSVICF